MVFTRKDVDFMGYVSFREGKPNVGKYSRHAGIWEGFKKGLAAVLFITWPRSDEFILVVQNHSEIPEKGPFL